jgi:hypothetical protein
MPAKAGIHAFLATFRNVPKRKKPFPLAPTKNTLLNSRLTSAVYRLHPVMKEERF